MASSCNCFEQDNKVIHVLCDAVALFHSVIPLHCTREDMFTPIRKVRPYLRRSSQISEILNNMHMTWIGLEPGRTISVASKRRNFWMPLNRVVVRPVSATD
jgi:hypothetical protein